MLSLSKQYQVRINVPMLYKTEAIIIKTKDLGEADKIVILISKNKGRIETIAKGARKPTSKKSTSIDLNVYASFAIASGKNLDVITELKVIDSHEDIRSSLLATYVIYYIFDLVNSFYTEKEQGAEILPEILLINKILEDLIKKGAKSDIFRKLVTIFEVKLLHKTGFFKAMSKRENMSGQEIRTVKILNFVEINPLSESMKLKLNEKDLSLLEKYLYDQIVDIIERKPKSYDLLQKCLISDA